MHGHNGGVLASPCHVCMVNGGVAKFSTSAFNHTHPVLVLSLRSQPLVKAPTRDSALASHPVLLSAAAERHINGRCPLPPLTEVSYLDIGIESPLRRMPAINAMTPSTALAPLYKHSLLTGNGAQTLDPDRALRRTQT
jgi:hypothetical protein